MRIQSALTYYSSLLVLRAVENYILLEGSLPIHPSVVTTTTSERSDLLPYIPLSTLRHLIKHTVRD